MRRFVLSFLLAFMPLVQAATIADNPIVIKGMAHYPKEISDERIHAAVYQAFKWYSQYNDSAVNVEIPELRLASEKYLLALHEATTGIVIPADRTLTGLLYHWTIDGKRYTMLFLNEDFDITNPSHESVIVHEVIHAVQFSNWIDLIMTRDCYEAEAYKHQVAWLEEFGEERNAEYLADAREIAEHHTSRCDAE